MKAYVNRCKTDAAYVDVIRDRVARSALEMGHHAPGVFPSHQYDSCQKLRAARYETLLIVCLLVGDTDSLNESRRRDLCQSRHRHCSRLIKFAFLAKVKYPELDNLDQVRHPRASAILVLFQARRTEGDIG